MTTRNSSVLSTKYDKPLIISINGSQRFAVLVALAHLGAMAILLVLSLPGWVVAGLWSLLGVSLYRTLDDQALRLGPRAVLRLELRSADVAALGLRNGDYLPVCRVVSRMVLPRLVVLALRCEGEVFSRGIVLTPDAVDAELMRALRVRLNLRASPSATA